MSKRLLSMLLAICLVVTCLAPAAYAVEAPADSYVNTKKEDTKVTDTKKTDASNGLIVSDDAADTHTMRDTFIPKVEEQSANGDGKWVAKPADKTAAGLLKTEAPECIEELKKAAEIYSKEELVVAFVVLEDKPLAELYTSPNMAPAADTNKLVDKQDAVINAIKGIDAELDVRYQFTYLTNAISIRTAFGNLEKIAQMKGVKTVFLAPVYHPCETAAPNTASSGAMTGVDQVWEDLGYTGTGMKIAIVDTGLDLDHPSFAADPETNEKSMTAEDITAVLEKLNAYKLRGSVTVDQLYRSVKVPYAFNYVDRNLKADHMADGAGDHGTHVAGIAAANALETTSVVGMAPDAQLIIMKVFGANGGAYTDDIVAAIEDSMTLGCDVVNASLGSPAGFSSIDPEIDKIYQRLASQDIIATISAGNEGTSGYGNMWGTDVNRTQNPENGAVGQPSTFANTFSIASAENATVMSNYFALADGTKIFYMDSIEYLLGDTPACMAWLDSVQTEYVIVPNLGDVDDFYDEEGNSIVEGKIAVIKRGELSFADKAWNATNAGAAAVVIWNNNDDDDIYTFGMTTESEIFGIPYIPVCLVTMTDGQKMADAETKTLTPTDELAPRATEGGQMSSFSSWGTTPDLRLLPDITGIGGNVYSCYDGGQYGLMSGTSMSAPQIAGISALVMQSLQEKYPNAQKGQIRELAMALMMSTADPIIDSTLGYFEASPRQQGAGLINAAAAVTSEAYLTVGGNRPKAELGDNANGVYSFSFEIHNTGDAAVTYTLDSSLLTEYAAEAAGEYFMAGFDAALSGSVEFSEQTVTVAAGATAEVTVTITLSENDKAYFAECWKNGGYVEGYIYLYNEEGKVALNLPFLGFYGDWTDAPAFDTAFWYNNSFWSVPPANGLPEGDEYYNVMWTDLAGMDWVLGFNPYSGAVTDADGNIVYDPANNVVSPNGDGALDGLTEVYLSLLRNAKKLTFTYTVDGETVHQDVFENNRKTMYISAYGQVVPWIYSWVSDEFYDFTDAEGNVLPSGTQVLLTVRAELDYGDGGDNVIEIPITVDIQMPELVEVYELEQDGVHYLAVEAKDNHSLASVVLMNPSATRIYDQAYDVTMMPTEDGTMIALFDVSELGTDFTVVVCDYAANENYYEVTYTSAGDNLPEIDTDQLYAYRVFDDYIYSDHMYGWVSLSKPASADETADISVHTDDYLEYAAINAAEYVGGKIFAVDAVYNLFIMDPGLFDRQMVTNLGVNVVDMTFDDSTDTMYVLTKSGSYTYLNTMDLLTGELTQLKMLGYYTNSPWAIADDDNGTLYAIKPYSAGIFTIDTESYAVTQIQDAEGNNILIQDSTGSNVSATAHSQSITWADGKLYWAYFKNSYYGGIGELITIDTATWENYASIYSAVGYYEDEEVVYNPGAELVGLMAMNETDYQFPASEEAVALELDAQQIILSLGKTQKLKASCLPWNYDLDKSKLVWTSADESIATVVDGVVTAVSEGVTEITVSYGDLSASCEVICVEIAGHFEAYNYYSGDGNYGNMIDVDMETMDYSLVGPSPVDFVAGDYNGHDGYFYGFDMGGQMYRLDYSDGSVTALGAPLGTYPVDMAYNYATGMMYALVLDYNTYENTLYAVNMSNGARVELAKGMGIMTLACATDGTLYGVDASGYVCQLEIMDYTEYGAGMYLEAVDYVLEEPFGDVYMLASMCWDHNNDVLLWNYCDAATVLWIDVENRFYVDLGDPTESGVVELVGMHVVPENIEPLPEIAIESVTAEDMIIFTGYEKVAAVTVAPFNATCQTMALSSADTSVVEVTETGLLKGVAPGTAEVTATLEDTVGEKTYEVTFTVTVMDCADNLNGHLLTDMANMAAQLFIGLNPGNPAEYEMNGYFDYTVFTEEYFDGKLYTYGYDANDYTANWQYFVLDANTFEIEQMVDMGASFPFVYDMTYDYVTGTMYVLAGAGEDNTDLYVADMETGTLTLLMEIEPLLMAIAASPEGKLYAIENSKMVVDEWDPWAEPTIVNAMLHTIDPLSATMELVGDTGLKSNMISSMTYDYDTDTMYWTPIYRESMMGGAIESCLAMVDLETAAAMNLGTIGAAGAQVGGLYVICDEFPETDTENLLGLLLAQKSMVLFVGDSTAASAILMPNGVDAELTWSSSDEAVATVDADGVITAVAVGNAEITATASLNGVTKTASCAVTVMDPNAAFLTWNATDMGWSSISRMDYTNVTNLTEGEEIGVAAIAAVGDDIYGYDVNNQLFKLDTATFERTPIGEGLGIEVEEDMQFVVKDLAYDAANEQLVLLADTLMWDPDWEEYSEIYNGCGLYFVDLTTGELEQFYAFGEYAYVYAMTIDEASQLYFYTTYDDYIRKLDMNTGNVTSVVSLQTQSLAGDMYCDYTLHYDALTNTIYMLFTSNGNFYKMLTVEATQGTLVDAGYVGEMVEEGWYIFTDSFNGLADYVAAEAEDEPKIVFSSLSLKGNIALNYYIHLPESVVNDANAYVQFTLVDGEVIKVPVSEGVKKTVGGEVYYVFSCAVAAKEMTDDVQTQIFYGEGKSTAVDHYSVKAYADAALASESTKAELKAMMVAMLHYGAAAQVDFNYNTENLANADLEAVDLSGITAEDLAAYASTGDGTEKAVFYGSSLLLKSETSLRIFFQVAEGATLTVTKDGTALEISERSGLQYVTVENISAKDLGKAITLTVSDGTDTATVEASALSYVYDVLKAEGVSDSAVTLAKSLYNYYLAADVYFNK